MKKRQKKKRGINVLVSPEAHAVMFKETIKTTPRLTLREYVNIINKVPKDA